MEFGGLEDSELSKLENILCRVVQGDGTDVKHLRGSYLLQSDVMTSSATLIGGNLLVGLSQAHSYGYFSMDADTAIGLLDNASMILMEQGLVDKDEIERRKKDFEEGLKKRDEEDMFGPVGASLIIGSNDVEMPKDNLDIFYIAPSGSPQELYQKMQHFGLLYTRVFEMQQEMRQEFMTEIEKLVAPKPGRRREPKIRHYDNGDNFAHYLQSKYIFSLMEAYTHENVIKIEEIELDMRAEVWELGITRSDMVKDKLDEQIAFLVKDITPKIRNVDTERMYGRLKFIAEIFDEANYEDWVSNKGLPSYDLGESNPAETLGKNEGK